MAIRSHRCTRVWTWRSSSEPAESIDEHYCLIYAGTPAARRRLSHPLGGLAQASGFQRLPLAFFRLTVLGFTGGLGPDPIEFITLSTGLWTLVFLCITLALTPLRRLTGINEAMRLRRMLGLFVFFYALLHLTTYLWFDQWFDLASIGRDIFKRPFITVGFLGFVLLAALAITSPRAMVRRLGRNWARLHKMVYCIGVLAILHFWWIKAGKHDLLLPQIYGAIMAVLLTARWVFWLAKRLAPSRRL
jgi:methionine sulfoxide reductase heme-binding subunit